MKYNHPSITLEEPAPGCLVITGHAPRSRFVEGVGHLVPPSHCIIPAEIPPDLLRAIADHRDGIANTLPVRHTTEPLMQREDDPLEPLDDAGTAPPPLLERLLNILAEGNIKLGKLAERLGVGAEEIKALDAESQAFHIARAGWVKLGKKEGEA